MPKTYAFKIMIVFQVVSKLKCCRLKTQWAFDTHWEEIDVISDGNGDLIEGTLKYISI